MRKKVCHLGRLNSKIINHRHLQLLIARHTQSEKDKKKHLASAPDNTLTKFPDNSYVLVEYFENPPSKLHPRLQGPYRVVNHIGSRYSLQNLVTDIKFLTFLCFKIDIFDQIAVNF